MTTTPSPPDDGTRQQASGDSHETRSGTVYLVGAGPGDPGLLTLRGAELLARADLVLYDGLVNPLLLRHAQAETVRTCRSMVDGRDRILKQDAINQRLIDAALAGKTVVRLKGGDPLIFGRGSEEAAALHAAGIPFEIVPGITAATGAGSYAGIPLTQRNLASAVALITGHEDPEKDEPSLDYRNLAAFPGTLVFYMGLHRLPQIVSRLITAGKSPQTPAAVISRATTPLQRVVQCKLGGLADAATAAELRAPSLIIIGECVRQRDALNWFEQRPLLGQRIAIARPEEQCEQAVHDITLQGGLPVVMPAIQIQPVEDWSAVDAVLERLPEFEWIIFTSRNGVQGLLRRLWQQGYDARRLSQLKIATIGPATAESLHEFGLRADLVPQAYRAEELAQALSPHVSGQRVLWARASRGRDVLPRELDRAGAKLTELVVYQNIDEPDWPAAVHRQLDEGEIDWLCLTSPSIARNALRQLSAQARAHVDSGAMRLATISPVTSAAVAETGLPVAAEATTYTWPGLLQAIVEAARAR